MEQPKQVKHYEILSRLGEGGMGVVYRARDQRLGRLVALKMLPGELARDDERSRRFEREARIVSALTHPGIATLYDYDHDGKTAFLTMELVEGANLRQRLASGPLPVAEAVDCAVQVAEALAAAHRGGVVHRDLKPENIMAADSGYYKVLDFGVARLDDSDSGSTSNTQTPTRTWATKSGSLLGTVAYMSPEQILGRPVDPRSDVFSLGSVVHELVTGIPAFSGPSDIATAHAIAYEPPKPLGDAPAQVSPGLTAVLTKCLQKEAEDRYPDAEALARDLRTVRANDLSGVRDTANLLAHVERRRSLRRRSLLGGAAIAAFLGLAWLGRSWLGSSETAPPAPSPLPAAAARVAPSSEGPAFPAVATGRRRVVVAFFENNTGDNRAEWISRGLPEMLTTDLARSEGLEIIATQRLHDLLAAAGRDPGQGLDRSTTAELARWAGADVVISGSVFRSDSQYRIDAQAYDTGSGTVITAQKAEGTDLFALVNRLTTGLLEGLSVSTNTDDTGVLTGSEEALQAFLHGKSRYESLSFVEAEQAFRESLTADPGFELARLHLAMSLIHEGRHDDASPLLAEVAIDAASLPEAEALLARGLDAYFVEGDHTAGAGFLEQLVERFPENAHANVWAGLALSQLEGKPLQATRKLRQALENDPNDLLALVALADQLARLGATDKARAMLADAATGNPDAEAELRSRIESYGAVEDGAASFSR